MKPVVAAIAMCGLVLTALPDVALDAANAAAEEAVPQDAPMSREQRIQVQQGLSALGFDPGPADGLFGPKTRAAIWDWQNAKGLEATGFLTREEAEALGAMGQAAGAHDEVSDPDAAEPDEPAFEEGAPGASGSKNRVLYFPQCSGLDELPPDEAGCWQAISNRQKCELFLPRSNFGSRKDQVAWSGVCRHNAAHGRGTLKYDSAVWDEGSETLDLSGTIVKGKMQGDWTGNYRTSDGLEGTIEGHFMDGEANGHWVYRGRLPDGVEFTIEGPIADGVRHGRWVQRTQHIDGTEVTTERSYVDGKEHGRRVQRFRYPDGDEDTLYFECHHGECEEQ